MKSRTDRSGRRKPLRAVIPGSFDPITYGHIDIIERAAGLFDSVVVGILVNPAKSSLFTVEERTRQISRLFARQPSVTVDAFEGLLVNWAKRVEARVIVRGIRAVSDYEYELQMALMNRRLEPTVDTHFLLPREEFSFLSSRLVKEVCSLGGNVTGLVPPLVEKELRKKLGESSPVHFDIFFSISQTPVDGRTPSEAEMFRNFLDQVTAADQLGFGTAWIAESHLSSEVQKRNRNPVIPHWQGEVGLNADFLQLAHHIFRRTRRIEAGSAVMNILCNGGPVAAAERVAVFAALHGLDPEEKRRIHVGFAAGRFEFMNRAAGIVARSPFEEAAWPALRGRIFAEAAEIFVRLLRGDTISSDDVRRTFLSRADFRSDVDWLRVVEVAGEADGPDLRIEIPRRFTFEELKIVPQEWRRELVQLVIGSHEPSLQEEVNALAPVQVFNLSITKPEIIEDTHRRMTASYHSAGGAWQRGHMPRTVFVFLNEQPGLSPEERRAAAQEEARAALSAYWTALEGTLDPKKVEGAADNALIGNAADVARQIVERFHPDDRLMLWFDFFNHDNARVIADMEAFMTVVAPVVVEALGIQSGFERNNTLPSRRNPTAS